MKLPKNDKEYGAHSGEYSLEEVWEKGVAYIKTMVDVERDSVLILDHDLRVIAANPRYYWTFQVNEKDIERRHVYELGNGQWNSTTLRMLLVDIIVNNTFFKGHEVTYDFPHIGRRTMILNARQMYVLEDAVPQSPPTILLAIEDVTEIMMVAKTLASHATQLEKKLEVQVQNREGTIKKLEKEIHQLKKQHHR